MGCYQIFTLSIHGLDGDLVLIRVIEMSFNVMLPDPHCKYTRPTGGSDFNQSDRHEFQCDVTRSSL